MSKRLHIILPDLEMDEIRRLAQRQQMSIREWVRRALRVECSRQTIRDQQFKLDAIRRAAGYSFPTADIHQMLEEIERGYQQ
jgi:hypothetical protein